MTVFPPDDDQKFRDFLHQYRPTPPPPAKNLEDTLIQRVKEIPTPSRYRTYLYGLIAAAITVLSLGVWGTYRWLNPSPQLAVNEEEIETFLIESWTGVMGDTSTENQVLEFSWGYLINSEE